MPISKPDHVQVHRIEFAKQFKPVMHEYENVLRSQKWKNYGAAFAGLGNLAIGVGLGLMGYYVGQGLSGMVPVLEFGEVREDGTRISVAETILGKKEYTFYDEDGTQRKYSNPAAGIPLIGSLFGTGINLAEVLRDKGPSWSST
jgi:hypothetical protein